MAEFVFLRNADILKFGFSWNLFKCSLTTLGFQFKLTSRSYFCSVGPQLVLELRGLAQLSSVAMKWKPWHDHLLKM